MALKTRPPTGRVPWPLVLIEGPEKSGKSWVCAEFSACPRIGQMYWLDLGEGAGDEYGAIPGARYLVIEHDGTWASILGAVEEVRAEAQRAADAGQPPIVLTIDSATAEWDLHKDWASNRARKSEANRKKLAADPDADIDVTMNLWNDANARHRRLMTLLMTFPGIVLLTARGKEVAALDANGRPIPRTREYKVEGQKTLAFDASVWVRMSREQAPIVVGARSVHSGLRPGVDRPQPMPDFTLERLIFDALRCDPGQAHARGLVELRAGDDAPLTPTAVAMLAAAETAPDQGTLRRQYAAIGPALEAGDITRPEADLIASTIKLRKDRVPADPGTNGQTAGVTQDQHKRMHVLWAKLKLGGEPNRDTRLARTALIVGHDIDSSAELTYAEAEKVIAALDRDARELSQVGVGS